MPDQCALSRSHTQLCTVQGPHHAAQLPHLKLQASEWSQHSETVVCSSGMFMPSGCGALALLQMGASNACAYQVGSGPTVVPCCSLVQARLMLMSSTISSHLVALLHLGASNACANQLKHQLTWLPCCNLEHPYVSADQLRPQPTLRSSSTPLYESSSCCVGHPRGCLRMKLSSSEASWRSCSGCNQARRA